MAHHIDHSCLQSLHDATVFLCAANVLQNLHHNVPLSTDKAMQLRFPLIVTLEVLSIQFETCY